MKSNSHLTTLFNSKLLNRIIDRHGEESFLRAISLAEEYKEKWDLDIVGPFNHFSSNMLFAGESKKHGPIVLKIQMNDNLDREISVLNLLKSEYMCPVYEYSPDDRVCLLKRIWPGHSMFFETTREQRAGLFCDLYKRLPRERVDEGIYPTYLDLLAEGKEVLAQRNDCSFMDAHMEKAAELIMSVNSKYKEKVLLHGDLHHENILRDGDGKYIIIDPKGIVGDPVYDISRFIAFEFWCDLTSEPSDSVVDFVNLIASNLSIPAETLFKCLYVETVIWLSREELANKRPPRESGKLICNLLLADSIVDAF